MSDPKQAITPRLLIILAVAVVALASIAWVFLNHQSVSAPKVSSPPAQSASATPTETVTKSGEMVCLPPKNSNGVQDMNCALGLKSGREYYGLSGGQEQLMGVATSQHITVMGTLTANTTDKFDTKGAIQVQTITKQ